ncbi:MAG: Alpha/beta hydrolase family protein [bacterium ADurb.Bin243]|nr:MAG: Alpha/beta hydrolase family protein [bacterium ADurb.Bin243]
MNLTGTRRALFLKLLFLLVSLPMIFSISAASADAKKSGSRSYIFGQNSAQIGKERYSYHIDNEYRLFATAEINISSGARVDLFQSYALASDGSFSFYSMTAEVMGEKQSLNCAFKDDEIKVKLFRKGTDENILLRTGGPVYLLDNMNANNFEHILSAYSHKKGGSQSFKIFVPQKLMLGELALEKKGFVKGRAAGKRMEFLEYRAVEKTSGLEIFIYAGNSGALAGVAVPLQKFSMSLEGFELDKTVKPLETIEFTAGKFKVKESGAYFKAKDGLKLYSKIMLPSVPESARVPGVVLIAGSGPTDHNGNSAILGATINTLRDIAERLAEEGIASMRYDKRNIGDSDSSGDSPFSSYVSDAVSAFNFFSAREGIDSDSIFLLGHSEGGLIAMSASRGAPKARGVILMAVPYTPFDKLILQQVKYNLDYSVSISDSDKADFINQLSDVIKRLKSGKKPKVRETANVPSMDVVVKSLVSQPKFVGEYLNIIPEKLASALKTPVLLIGAELDSQVPVSDFSAYCDLFAAKGKRFSKLLVPGVNHVFKPAKAKNDVSSYLSGARLSPAALDAVSDFIRRCCGR